MSGNIEIDEAVLFEHVHAHALEHADSIDVTVDDGVEWSLSGMKYTGSTTIETSSEQFGIVFHGTVVGTVHERIRASTRMQPAEYEHIDVDIHIDLLWIPEGNSGLGEIHIDGEQETYPTKHPHM